MELTTTEALKLDACLHHVAQWLQSSIEPDSKDHNLSESFEKHLKDLFKGRTKFSLSRETIPEHSSREFKLFVERIALPIVWFPVFQIDVNLNLESLISLSVEDTKQPIPIYTIIHFESERN